MQWSAFLILAVLYLCLPIQSWRSTRIRVLRTDDEKLRYLNHSKVLRENLFFGMRPILYVSRYSCDCQDTSVVPAANLDLPDFPVEDEVLPPPDQSPLRFSESSVPTPKLQPEPSSQYRFLSFLRIHYFFLCSQTLVAVRSRRQARIRTMRSSSC